MTHEVHRRVAVDNYYRCTCLCKSEIMLLLPQKVSMACGGGGGGGGGLVGLP